MMNINRFGRVLCAAGLTVGGLLSPVLGSGAVQAQSTDVDLTCTVDGGATFGFQNEKLLGVYQATYRACTSLKPEYKRYTQWNAVAKPVVATGCPPQTLTGSAALEWTDSTKPGQTVPGTAEYTINFLPTPQVNIRITSGPLAGDRLSAPTALAPVTTETLHCPNHVRFPKSWVIQGVVNFQKG